MITLVVLLFIFFHTCLVWLWYRSTNNPSVVDVGWATGLTLAGIIYLNHNDWTLQSFILGLILIIWGARLAGYLWYTRIRKKQVDKRYLALSDDWKIAKPLGFFLNFQFQGLLIFIISIPWYFASLNTHANFSLFEKVGLLLFIIAITFETLSDIQLNSFKKKFPNKVCNDKLWHYCRHPNYYFEWLIWCSFTIFALSVPYGWISIISPLTLYFLMTRVTAPLTEQGSIKSKGKQYVEYQKVTPMFFPKWYH
jgi:steroid 5-alpha reductase family enzyme